MLSPLRAPAATGALPNSIRPTGWIRAATDSGVRALGSALGLLVTSCTSSTMPRIGTRKASRMTMTSCWGVLMNEECGSCSVTGEGAVGLLGKGMILASKLAMGPCHGSLAHPVRNRARGARPCMAVAREIGTGPAARGPAHRARRFRLLLSADHQPDRIARDLASALAIPALTHGRGRENRLSCASRF